MNTRMKDGIGVITITIKIMTIVIMKADTMMRGLTAVTEVINLIVMNHPIAIKEMTDLIEITEEILEIEATMEEIVEIIQEIEETI